MAIEAVLRVVIVVALSAATVACTGGARLGGRAETEDASPVDTATAVTTGELDVSLDTLAQDANDTQAPPSCLETSIECGDHAYCSYPDGQCRAPVADSSDGWCVLPATAFMMGNDGDRGLFEYVEQQPRHAVILTHGIRMMATEVTAKDWAQLMGPLTNPHFPNCGEDCPATGGTTTAKLAYANAASERDGLDPCYGLEGCIGTGDQLLCDRVTYKGLLCRGYRLPTEAEAEFAARAGRDYCFDPTAPGVAGDRDAWMTCSYAIPGLTDTMWYCANSDVDYPGGGNCQDPGAPYRTRGFHPVGKKLPNGFGLYDALGNASELTTTLWSDGAAEPETDPGHPPSIPNDVPLVQHLSTYASSAMGCCPTIRDRVGRAQDHGGYTGFRLVQTLFDENK